MENRFLRRSGALCDGSAALAKSPYESWHRRGLSRRSLSARELAEWQVPEEVIDSIPESVARENGVFPLSLDDDCLTLAAADPDDIAVADKLRFILNRDIRARGFFRAVFFFPVLLSPVVVALIWKWILQRFGVLNAAMEGMGLSSVDWMLEANLAFGWSVFLSVWAHMGFYTLILLAGLQAIPRDVYDSELLSPLLDLIRGPDFRKLVEALGGYDASRMGEVVAEI